MDPRERDAKHIKEKERQELLNRAYQRVVGSKLEQLSKKKVTTGKSSFLKNPNVPSKGKRSSIAGSTI